MSNPRVKASVYGALAVAAALALRKRRQKKRARAAAVRDFAEAQAALKKATAAAAEGCGGAGSSEEKLLSSLKATVQAIKARSGMSERELVGATKPDPAQALWRMFDIVWPGQFAGRRIPTIGTLSTVSFF